MHAAPSARLARFALSPRARQRGVSSIMLLVLLIPLLLAVGVAVDFARMVQFRSDLQNAVDEAALAGAAAFLDSTQSAQAVTVATNYFNRAILPVSLSVSAPTVTTNASGTINPVLGNAQALTVTVSATANVQTTLMALVAPAMATISAKATAANPVVSANLKFPTQTYSACDGNTVYLYQVPQNASKTGYDYSSVPAFNLQNYYEIYTTYAAGTTLGTLPSQTIPTFSVNQPLGLMLRNDTNGNVGNSTCGIKGTGTSALQGANSYGAPNGSSQTFYSSLLMNGQSPSELSNYTYMANVTINTTTTQTSVTQYGSTTQSTSSSYNLASYTLTLPASTLYPNGKTITGSGSNLPSGYDQLTMVFGPNPPGTSGSGCSTVSSQTTVGQTTTTQQSNYGSTTTTKTTPSTTVAQYKCTTQYRTSKAGTGNCSLYVQTGSAVTKTYMNGITNKSSAPSAAQGTCFNMTSGGAQYSAPTCAQLSALGNTSTGAAPAAVFWWDDAGGEGPGELYYGPSSHCSQIGASSPGYGEDCKYTNMVVALQCQTSGGSGTGYTQVVLTQ
nr:pilus assembly protein TadG-related protein [Paraburkholderia sp. J63]